MWASKKDVYRLEAENKARKRESLALNKAFTEMKNEIKDHMDKEETRWTWIMAIGFITIGLLLSSHPIILRLAGFG